MVRSGAGARLVETREPRRVERVASRRASNAATVRPPARPAPPAPAVAKPEPVAVVADTGTYEFLPPPTRTRALPRGRGYRAPSLDLRTPAKVPSNPVECLTHAIYYEARNESEEGQAAVAEVVINRSRSGRYPQGICDVVYQRNSRTCQFTFTCDGSIGRGAINRVAWARAERIARQVHGGQSALLPTSSVNYHANYVRPSWGRRLERVRQIGAHIFYGAPIGGGSTPGAETRARPQAPTGLQFVRIEALDQAFARIGGTPASAATDPAAP